MTCAAISAWLQGAHHSHLPQQEEEERWPHSRYPCFCSSLLVATGTWVPNVVNFPGSEYVEGYETVSINPEDFAGQTVLILGRGNSAFETAENILGVTNFIHMVSRSRVRLSWATHYVGDLR